MGDKTRHKSTFEVLGVPSIIRLIKTLRNAQIQNNVVVIGAFSNQIMETISNYYSDVAFTYQPYQRGTGNAAKYGARLLSKMNFEGNILIVAGDAIINPDPDLTP